VLGLAYGSVLLDHGQTWTRRYPYLTRV
jgi:hypothetical protein